jgi:uncharacterized protein (TIGR03083 family)
MEPTLEDLREALRLASSAVAVFLRSEPDAQAMTRGGVWSVRDTAVHLTCGTRMYTGMLQGGPSPIRTLTDLPAWNAGVLIAMDEDRPKVLANLTERAVASFLDATSQFHGDDLRPYHFGLTLSTSSFVSALSYEYLLHGADLAWAVDRVWSCPELAADSTIVPVARNMAVIFDPQAAGGINASFAIKSPSTRCCYKVSDGSIEILDAAADVDCSIAGSSSRLLLWLTGRAGWEEARLSASGRESQLAPSFTDLFINP